MSKIRYVAIVRQREPEKEPKRAIESHREPVRAIAVANQREPERSRDKQD